MSDAKGKRRLSAKQKACSLFHLWHSIQDVKAEAQSMQDDELVLLIDMVELLVEERTTGLSQSAGGRARRNGIDHGMATA
jgi:hypothetical protein